MIVMIHTWWCRAEGLINWGHCCVGGKGAVFWLRALISTSCSSPSDSGALYNVEATCWSNCSSVVISNGSDDSDNDDGDGYDDDDDDDNDNDNTNDGNDNNDPCLLMMVMMIHLDRTVQHLPQNWVLLDVRTHHLPAAVATAGIQIVPTR